MNGTTKTILATLPLVPAVGCAGAGDGADRFDFPRVTGLDPLDVPYCS